MACRRNNRTSTNHVFPHFFELLFTRWSFLKGCSNIVKIETHLESTLPSKILQRSNKSAPSNWDPVSQMKTGSFRNIEVIFNQIGSCLPTKKGFPYQPVYYTFHKLIQHQRQHSCWRKVIFCDLNITGCESIKKITRVWWTVLA